MSETKRSRDRIGDAHGGPGWPEAQEHEIKTRIVMLIASVMERHGLTQTSAAARMGISQPDLSKLLRGSFRGFTLERLLACAQAIGIDFEIKAKPPADAHREGRFQLKVA